MMGDAFYMLEQIARREMWRHGLPVLAHNLAVAGALCLAWELGGRWTQWAWFGKYDRWRPGCGRPVEGWGK